MLADLDFSQPLPTEVGDKRPERIYLAVGKALTSWEFTENTFSYIYSTAIKPGLRSYTAKYSHGTIVSAIGRREVTEAALQIFFRTFEDAALKERGKTLFKKYGDAGARRNELAHGIVGGNKFKSGKFGHFLIPNHYGSKKRSLGAVLTYAYDAKMIHELETKFWKLRGCQRIYSANG